MIHAGDLCFTDRPAAPVNVSVTHLRADSATVSWNIPEGETVIGFAVSQQRQDGLMQRFIREVNTTSRACILWDLDEDTDYIIQVQSVGVYGESLASKKIHFRTLKKSEHIQSTMMDQGKHIRISRSKFHLYNIIHLIKYISCLLCEMIGILFLKKLKKKR
uniref:Fibronectin type III domain containing 4 n=1 Tax=Sinocyclocheilus grahami TaxID=75366 RepID=A0A672TF03_SINGR